jgi:choline-sulfatase
VRTAAPLRQRQRIRAAAGLLALVLASGCAPHGERRPNIVLLSIDTLNRSALRTYEPAAPALPNLDRLASQSLVFERCASTASWTLPAHGSLLTGLYPARHGARQRYLALAPDAEPVATQLARVGYETVAFTDGGFMSPAFGFARGFGRYDEVAAEPALAELELPRDGRPADVPGVTLFERATRYLEQRAPGRPFFLFLHTFSLHEYYRARPWTRASWEAEPRPPEYYQECLTGQRPGTSQDWRMLRALYRAELAHLDAGVGRLLAELERLDLARDTLVILVSDHGEGLDPRHGRIHHGGRLNADLVDVPMLVHGPDVAPGREETPVSLVDVAPTLLELAGAPIPTGLDGRSLGDLLEGAPADAALASRPLFAEGYAFDWWSGKRVEFAAVRSDPARTAVLVDCYWYIRHDDGAEELYRRDLDPLQRSNLASSYPELAELRRLAELHESVPIQGSAPDEVAGLEERLRSLGY